MKATRYHPLGEKTLPHDFIKNIVSKFTQDEISDVCKNDTILRLETWTRLKKACRNC